MPHRFNERFCEIGIYSGRQTRKMARLKRTPGSSFVFRLSWARVFRCLLQVDGTIRLEPRSEKGEVAMRASVFFILMVLLISCASVPQHELAKQSDTAPRFYMPKTLTLTSAEQVTAKTRVGPDPFNRGTQIKGPWITTTIPSGGFQRSRLRHYNTEQFNLYQLYVQYQAEKWALFEQAYDILGNELKFTKIERQVHKPWIWEDFAITLERAYLNRASTEGLSVKAIGRLGETVLELPAFYIQGFLQKVDSWEK